MHEFQRKTDMCTFLIAIVPADAKLDRLEKELEAHRLAYRAFHDDRFQPELSPGEIAFYTTRGHCDCGTELGSGTSMPSDHVASEEAKRRKKGWSEAKIARWRDEQELQREKRSRRRNDDGQGEAELIRWLGFLQTILVQGISNRIVVFIQTHSLKPPNTPFSVLSRVRVRRAEMTPDFLRHMTAHTLYEFVP
jgi:hypothetical protein